MDQKIYNKLFILLTIINIIGIIKGQQCGVGHGVCEDPNPCCNKDGICGSSFSDCGIGCQSEFGICNGIKSLLSLSLV